MGAFEGDAVSGHVGVVGSCGLSPFGPLVDGNLGEEGCGDVGRPVVLYGVLLDDLIETSVVPEAFTRVDLLAHLGRPCGIEGSHLEGFLVGEVFCGLCEHSLHSLDDGILVGLCHGFGWNYGRVILFPAFCGNLLGCGVGYPDAGFGLNGAAVGEDLSAGYDFVIYHDN